MALFDEVRQEAHHPQVALAAAESSCDGRRLLVLRGVRWTSFAVTEGVEQSLVGQRGQAALQVQQVGDASAEAAVRVGQSADQGAAVGRAAQSPLVQVQQGQVTTVSSQRVDDGGRGAGGGSEEKHTTEETMKDGRETDCGSEGHLRTGRLLGNPGPPEKH